MVTGVMMAKKLDHGYHNAFGMLGKMNTIVYFILQKSILENSY